MSIWRQKFRSDWRLWWGASLVLFVLGGFINLLPGIKGSDHFWGHVNRLLYSGQLYNTEALTAPVIFLGMMLAVPALVLGWLMQALVFFALGACRGDETPRAT